MVRQDSGIGPHFYAIPVWRFALDHAGVNETNIGFYPVFLPVEVSRFDNFTGQIYFRIIIEPQHPGDHADLHSSNQIFGDKKLQPVLVNANGKGPRIFFNRIVVESGRQ